MVFAGLLVAGCNGGATGVSASEGLTGVTTGATGPEAAPEGESGAAPTMGGSDSHAGEGSATGTESGGGGPSGDSVTGGAVTASGTTGELADPTSGPGGSTGQVDGVTAGGGTGGPADPMDPAEPMDDPPPACVPVECSGKVYACGDCEDNDGDGKTDAADPECVGPCDDREDSFATDIPGDNMDPCKQDCFFDGNSGQSKGECGWNLKCDPKEPLAEVCAYDEGANCPELAEESCLAVCQVPNGCDCFGCCTVAFDGAERDVYIGDANCSLAHPEKCMECTKVKACENECEPDDCEVCFGQTEPAPGCPGIKCEDGLEACVGGWKCEQANHFCSAGCCVPAPA